MPSLLRCIVVTPEETVLEIEAEFVVLPLYDGEIGIALNHAPLIGRLGYGEMRIRLGAETTRLYVDGGFVQVDDNVVSVLTNQAMPPERLNARALEQHIATTSSQRAAGDEAIAVRTRTLQQARGQLRVANRID